MNKIINWMGAWPREGLVSASDWGERLASAADRYRISRSMRPQPQDRLAAALTQQLLKEKSLGKQERLRFARGADAALTMLAAKSLKIGDVVLVARPTSRTALQIFRKSGASLASVAGDEYGMDPDALSSAIAQYRPRLVYAAPICADPEGGIWSDSRVREITEICCNSRVLLLRDDRQEMLAYETRQSGQDKLPTREGVLSVGQLPPGLIAGFRFGWVTGAPRELAHWLPDALETMDGELENSPLEYQGLTDLMREQPLPDLIDMLRVQCRERMRLITAHLARNGTPRMTWRIPEGGIHLWVTLPAGLDGEALLRGAWLKGLMFQPGAAFYVDQPVRHTVRLTFAGTDERTMKIGTVRLFEAIDEFMGRFDYV